MKIYIVGGYCPFNCCEMVSVYKDYSEAMKDYNCRKNEIGRVRAYNIIKEIEYGGDYSLISELKGERKYMYLKESKLK